MLEIKIIKNLPGFRLKVAFNTKDGMLALVGPSGSGKSMTLQCIAGLLMPDEGCIIANGRVLFDSNKGLNLAPQKRRIGFVFQNYALFPHMKLAENVASGIRYLQGEKIRERVAFLLKKMKLQGLENRYPAELSGGQQQRAALARALAPDPEVLLLDEPFSALDTQVKEELEKELLEINSFYQGDIVFVTHNLSEAYRFASKIAVCKNGHILQFDDKREVVHAPVSVEVARFTGVKNLLRGTITYLEDSVMKVWIPSLGKELKTKRPACRHLEKGQSITIGMRPEHLQVTDKEGENTITVWVAGVVENIDGFEYTLCRKNNQGEGMLMEGKCSSLVNPLPSVGKTCHIRLDSELLTVITDDRNAV